MAQKYNFKEVKQGKIEDRELIYKNCECCGFNYIECGECHRRFKDTHHFDIHVCRVEVKE